jgi:ectoine hydroxylase-related dioxygenase (phytanoyl-CoA dioxygenase family)
MTILPEYRCDLEKYSRTGVLGPFDLFSPAQAETMALELSEGARKVPGLRLQDRTGLNREAYWRELGRTMPWFKSMHLHIPVAKRIALSSELTSVAGQALDRRDLLSWGVDMVDQNPGERHRWHVDLECEQHSVTVWLALRNAGPRSGLKLLPGSHRTGTYPQALKVASGLNLDDDEAVLRAAQAINQHVEIVAPDVRPGQFILFSGLLWHSSFNLTLVPRTALVLQYAAAGATIRIPTTFEPPLSWHEWSPPVVRARAPQ